MKNSVGLITVVLVLLFWEIHSSPTRSFGTPASDVQGFQTTILDCFEKAAAIEYESDPNDFWQTPHQTGFLQRGDCEDKALYLQALLEERDIEANVVFGLEDAERSNDWHAWVEFDWREQPYILDPTNGFIGRRASLAPGRHMPILGDPRIMKKIDRYRQRFPGARVNRYYTELMSILDQN